ncbi:hypothetical protein Aph02nite_14160 [Actinoplanes philippinensis]|nr:hypothetical protein [Actinoplanes philippinensis]GIE75466.1 hypothetical protein Aph02nite_14160 [Actinoplanes philippinensis]
MSFLTASAARRAVTVLMIVLAICGTALTLDAKPAGAAASSDRLVLTWAEDGNRLQVTGVGYRARDLVEVRLGSNPIQQTRGDDNGRIEVSVPETLLGAGMSGASIVLAGRSVSGTSRILISAIPPRAAARGPVDLLPWALGAVALAALPLGLWLRRRTRAAATDVAPSGYRSRHAA